MFTLNKVIQSAKRKKTRGMWNRSLLIFADTCALFSQLFLSLPLVSLLPRRAISYPAYSPPPPPSLIRLSWTAPSETSVNFAKVATRQYPKGIHSTSSVYSSSCFFDVANLKFNVFRGGRLLHLAKRHFTSDTNGRRIVAGTFSS